MNQIKSIVINTCLIISIIPFVINCQNTSNIDKSNEKLLVAAREIMNAAGNCALITLDRNSLPMVRIMDPFPPEDDFTVWFGTNSKSRKVSQIKNNPNVTLYYQDSDASGYVVIHGKAAIIDDQMETQNRWKERWKDFYPNNREGYVLIKVSPDSMEILSTTRNIIGDPKTWKTPVVKFE